MRCSFHCSQFSTKPLGVSFPVANGISFLRRGVTKWNMSTDAPYFLNSRNHKAVQIIGPGGATFFFVNCMFRMWTSSTFRNSCRQNQMKNQ